ncbi:MAG: hypothetical protein HYZ49_05780 [Chloroflexi bacterium]|nr:hypothetical protein [Chloroflexota bacterium]
MDVLGLAFTCVLGLLVGGVLGGFGVAVLQQIRTGRIKIPPTIALGPVKLDTSGLSPQTAGATQETDVSSVGPLIEGGGSATGGCLSLIGAGMVLVGFVLPWFTCSVPLLAIQGSVSGFSAFVQLVFGVLLSLVSSAGIGTQRGGGGLAALGLLLTLVLVAAAVFLTLTPLMGLQIGRTGLRLIQSLKITNEQRRRTARSLTIAAVVGFVPLLCYMTSTMTNFSVGVQVQNLGAGLWVTMAGFALAFVAGIIISTAAALSEQLPKPPAKDKGS